MELKSAPEPKIMNAAILKIGFENLGPGSRSRSGIGWESRWGSGSKSRSGLWVRSWSRSKLRPMSRSWSRSGLRSWKEKQDDKGYKWRIFGL